MKPFDERHAHDGADDYIVKPFDESEFIARVQRVAPLFSGGYGKASEDPRLERLTPRERDVLRFLADGHDQAHHPS